MNTLNAGVQIVFALCLTELLEADAPRGVEPTSGIIVRGDQPETSEVVRIWAEE